ncbi:MAG: ATP-binding cassette domain-containing protein [Verrucomicrobiota bacterium]
MIRVQQLTKKYYGKTVVREVSFEVGRGEIVGFLGPNGAGKTTTLRMITGYLSPTQGRVEVDGIDVVAHSLEARRRIGYMPENVPLYPEMRVKEYLRFRAELKGVPRKECRERTEVVMKQCGLEEVRRKIIQNLSKGYRQRVGLADALIHRPPLLILDEPTNGLDPNQIRQVRDFIKNLGEKHTILLSTHILSEVEAICDKVIILDRGTVKASDTPGLLAKQLRRASTLVVEVQPGEANVERLCRKLAGVRKVVATPLAEDWTRLVIRCVAGEDVRPQLDRLVKEHGWPLREFRFKRASLEDVFTEITHPDA